ncbi:MAG: DUF4062 domain-containing protein [Pirellulaceae bacterium]
MQPRYLPIIRVFISSSFADLEAERDALQGDAFPRLEAFCRQYGFQFQAIDLRWGVPGEAGLDHRTMRICFDELRRSQHVSPEPNFLILLGNRYGWRPLPEAISEDEFNRLLAVATSGKVPGIGSKSAEGGGYRTLIYEDAQQTLRVFLRTKIRSRGPQRVFRRDIDRLSRFDFFQQRTGRGRFSDRDNVQRNVPGDRTGLPAIFHSQPHIGFIAAPGGRHHRLMPSRRQIQDGQSAMG